MEIYYEQRIDEVSDHSVCARRDLENMINTLTCDLDGEGDIEVRNRIKMSKIDNK